MVTLIILLFLLGYFLIAFEHYININKAAVALLTGVLCWVVYAFSADKEVIQVQLGTHFGEISGILFFLLGAMAIVEFIDAHDGFDFFAEQITTSNKRSLLWIICSLSFLLSAILDNLTTTIVMVTLLRKLVAEKEDRMLFIGMVIIASNAGGVWSPIGDVTTTMLWIGGQVSAKNIMVNLLLPSLVSMLLPLLVISLKINGEVQRRPISIDSTNIKAKPFQRMLFFVFGVGVLISVPVFKSITHLPPFMGMLFGLGVLWLLSEIVDRSKDEVEKDVSSVLYALRKVDMPSILFFLGILLAVAALQSSGLLVMLSTKLNTCIPDLNSRSIAIGLISAIIDNVPLVAAAIGMYPLDLFPMDHYFWEFLAYCTGTGGSILIIGSAAGVAAMGMEKISFSWYLKKISFLALIGYFAGAIVYILQHYFLGN